ncbi:Cytochrome c oxidase subunit 1 [bacterium HR26]|nr:Cytochrome c oxidase subunit 1 [bacterium HR26]
MSGQPTHYPADLGSVHRLTGVYITVALISLTLANVPSLYQALDGAGINLYAALPVFRSYYQGLTLHGVGNVLLWTTFFICGFLSFTMVYSLRRPLASMRLAWATFWIMLLGLVLTITAILTNQATVLYTFYPPMRAHPAFYIGLTLVVVGTWLVLLNFVMTYRRWRASHPGEPTPLAAFGSLITFVMWTIASVGVAVEMVFLLIPWSLGLVSAIDPLLARSLFWFTGHPIVYFWLLPAVVSWYTMLPKIAGGRLFSETIARIAFIVFLIYSLPVGLHHQFTDPGISEWWKLVHAFFTFIVFFASLLTMFNVAATLENAGRARGARGWLNWILPLPWHEPAFVSQVLGMLLFIFGGISGLANASYNVNLVVHNTRWIVGHFHLTVGAAVTLTFMGITYWLVPYLTGRALWSRRLALVQAWSFFVGEVIFSETLHRLGVLGMPRRTQIAAAEYLMPEWQNIIGMPLVGIGGTIMFVSGILYLLNIALTLAASREPARVEVPLAEYAPGERRVPAVLDRWRPWVIITITLTLVAWLPPLITLLASMSPVRGARVW